MTVSPQYIIMENKRLKLGIIFNFRSGWMGGIIYILNVIKVLDFLDDEEKPEITLFYRSDLKNFVEEIDYPYLKVVESYFPSVAVGFVKSLLVRKNLFISKILTNYDLDGLFPMHDYPVRTRTSTRLVAWYADLQHEYYPEYFSRFRLLKRKARIRYILKNSDDLVLSSKAVEDDFRKFYKIRENLRMHIFHFASVIPDLSHLKIEDIRRRYRVPTEYYMVSNQFHPHKNHKLLLEAMVFLKKKGVMINYIFSGRLPDESHSSYLKELRDTMNRFNLHGQVIFLGVIPRQDQLMLMKHSKAVIQPSLFEGWSTVIEDAISLQVPIIASNLQVNIEQLGEKGNYFDPDEPSELANILIHYPERNMECPIYDNYHIRVKNAAKSFMKIFS